MNQAGRDIFSVSRLNMEVRSALENSFPLLWVTGEISNLAMPRSGHLYFSLKDASAQVRCAMFRNRRNLLRFQPGDGTQVIVRARVTVYEPRGDLQLVIEHMEPAGEGLLRQQVEELARKLREEGLFGEERKKPLPTFPRRIGVVTSPSGAAIRDVLTVLKRRCPSIPVVVYPVAVQGKTAAGEITEMLKIADRRKECDLLILTRGGGSLEDLMAFNDEQLARTIAGLSIPLISAIGHEIDTSISDHVADRRAPTPSAAAELASPDSEALLHRVDLLAARIQRTQAQHLQRNMQRLDELGIRLQQQHPGVRLQHQAERITTLRARLQQAGRNRTRILHASLDTLATRLQARAPARRVSDTRSHLERLGKRFETLMRQRVEERSTRVKALARELHAISPLATLERGYSITLNEKQQAITDSNQVNKGEELEIRFARGSIQCEVTEKG
ncbi:MAG: exodeoxyribonuclease VII large subunit [Chromatiales bacterium]|jgi:exodeoxyribonuclease VII large subunit